MNDIIEHEGKRFQKTGEVRVPRAGDYWWSQIDNCVYKCSFSTGKTNKSLRREILRELPAAAAPQKCLKCDKPAEYPSPVCSEHEPTIYGKDPKSEHVEHPEQSKHGTPGWAVEIRLIQYRRGTLESNVMSTYYHGDAAPTEESALRLYADLRNTLRGEQPRSHSPEPGEAVRELAEKLAFVCFGVKSKSAEDEVSKILTEALAPLLEKAREASYALFAIQEGLNKAVAPHAQSLAEKAFEPLRAELTRWERKAKP